MTFLLQQIKRINPKKTLGVIVLAGLVAFLVSSPAVLANGPSFNIFPVCFQGGQNCDFPTLDGRNVTQGQGWSASQADHDQRVSANPGDIIKLSVYYHNGVPDTDDNVALAAFVQAFASPGLGTAAMTHVISASVGAQNAPTVSSSDPSRGGNITIRIQGSTPLSLSLVPGSVVLYPNQGQSPAPGSQPLPDSIFTSGVGIGNIRGCFQYHGFVQFELRVSQPPPPVTGSLQIQKQVRNVTAGGTVFQQQVNANPGDTVEYRITVSATGNALPNVAVRDTLDNRLSFVSPLTLDGVSTDASAFFGGGVNIGTVSPGSNRILKFQATVAAASQFSSGTATLPNTATAFCACSSVSDTANVIVTIQPRVVACTATWNPPLIADGSGRGERRVGDPANVHIHVTGLSPQQSFELTNQNAGSGFKFHATVAADSQGNYDNFDQSIIGQIPTGDYNSFIAVNSQSVATCTGFRILPPTVQSLSLTKTVRNDNTGTGFQNTVNASPSDQVTFQILLSPQNSNVTLQNVVLSDTLPAKLLEIPGSLNVNGVSQGEGQLFGSGLNLGTIPPNQPVTVTFRADVAGAASFTAGVCEDLTNTANVTASGNLSASGSATVHACKQTPEKQPGSPGQRPL